MSDCDSFAIVRREISANMKRVEKKILAKVMQRKVKYKT